MNEQSSQMSILDRAQALATATLGDALDAHRISGTLSGIERRAGSGRAAGFAQTMQQQAAPLGSFSFDDFSVGPAFDATVENTFLVVDMGSADISTFGGLAALTLMYRRAKGAVIDGGCRDVEEIQRIGLTVASRSVTPRTGKGRLRIVSRGQPVTCGGVCIREGDLIVADDTGIVAVPSQSIEAVLQTAEELDKRDSIFATRLQNGASFTETAASLRHA